MVQAVVGSTVTYEETPVFVAEPSGKRRGGVVVVQEAFGVNGHIEDICRRLADAGWVAAAPHFFWRVGDPILGYDGQMDEVMQAMGSLTQDSVVTDVGAALSALHDRGFDDRHCAITGFCMGGSVALITAARQALGAAVSFYGGGVSQGRFGFPPLVEVAPSLRTPWLGLYGDLDKGIPVEEVEALRAAAAKAAVDTEVVRYPDADHGFNCDARASYHPASARDAWDRMLRWFEAHIPAAG
jgi:carboxymethylenebutenolidase